MKGKINLMDYEISVSTMRIGEKKSFTAIDMNNEALTALIYDVRNKILYPMDIYQLVASWAVDQYFDGCNILPQTEYVKLKERRRN